MAKMIVLDPAITVELRGGWELIATEAGRYAQGLTATITLSNGTPQACESIPLADATYRNAFAQMVSYRTRVPCAELEAKLLEILMGIEGLFRQQQDDEEGARESQATRLIKLALESDAIFLRDQLGDAYCATMGDGREVLKVRSKKFRLWLRRLMWEAEEKAPGGQAIEDALGHLEGKAIFEGKEIPLEVRVAWEGNTLWYDLGGKAVKVTAAGWEVVNVPPILFRRFQATNPQVAPVRNGRVEEFLEFTRVKSERDRILLLVQLVVNFVPGFPQAAQVVTGDQGSAKTTLQKLQKALIDPSPALTLSAPDSVREFVQQASHHWILYFDNLASLPQWLSDGLCKAVTGEGFSKRELYSDDDDILYAFRRVVGLNGINLVVERPDLLDRSILVNLERIPDAEYREEKDLWTAFERATPRILGGIFDVLSRAMAIHPGLKLKALPRMADFARWGEAIARAMGYEPNTFLQAYAGNVEAQNEAAIEASPVAQALIAFMDGKTEPWVGTPTELLAHLLQAAEELKLNVRAKKWPKEPRWVWRRIKEVRPNLQALGIAVAIRREGQARFITLTRISGRNDVTDVSVDENKKKQDLRDDNTQIGDVTNDDTDVTNDDTKKPDVIAKPLKNIAVDDNDDNDIIFAKNPNHIAENDFEEGEV